MELKFKRKEIKYQVETLNIDQQDIITMIELFVKSKLDDEAQEVFYTELEGKEINPETVKDALYFAVLGNMSVFILKKFIADYEANPEECERKAKEFLKKENQ